MVSIGYFVGFLQLIILLFSLNFSYRILTHHIIVKLLTPSCYLLIYFLLVMSWSFFFMMVNVFYMHAPNLEGEAFSHNIRQTKTLSEFGWLLRTWIYSFIIYFVSVIRHLCLSAFSIGVYSSGPMYLKDAWSCLH